MIFATLSNCQTTFYLNVRELQRIVREETNDYRCVELRWSVYDAFLSVVPYFPNMLKIQQKFPKKLNVGASFKTRNKMTVVNDTINLTLLGEPDGVDTVDKIIQVAGIVVIITG